VDEDVQFEGIVHSWQAESAEARGFLKEFFVIYVEIV
jgi:hypothetical protein